MTDTSEFPKFKGEVVKRGDANYEETCYQYASSTYLEAGIVQPAAIIKPADDSDVIKAIKYARDNKIAVAVRTGGHQYSGGSSTGGKNIQLDLSETYKDFKWEDEDRTVLTFGISYALGEFNAKLGGYKRFVPHGQCKYVNIGGHIQSGGYGQLIRSFGLFSDNVIKFRIITADGQVRWVSRDVEQDKDLFFAVLGGSPGNFGVLTHATLHVFRDEDHPNSRGFRAVYPYTRHRLKALMDILVEMAADDDFPADYDLCVSVATEPLLKPLEITYDTKHRRRGLPRVAWIPLIVVFAQWANLEGARQKYDKTFVDKIQKVAGLGIVQVSDEKHVPMSTLTSHWIIPITREFDLPYIKHTYASNSSGERLKRFKWADWVSGRMDEAEGEFSSVAQLQHIGGSKSRFFQNGKNSPTSFSWRDTRLLITMDAFFYRQQHEKAIKWQQGNDEGVGKPDAPLCEEDHRVLWGSRDLDLSAAQKYYYDQDPEGKYERLCDIKKKYDPSGVFTPNRFCIGLPPVAEGMPEFKPTPPPEAAEVTAEEGSPEDRFWKMARMKREADMPIPLWHFWRV